MSDTLATKQRKRVVRFRIEIALLLTLKIALLLIVKELWFSEPVAPHMQVPADMVTQRFFSRAGRGAGMPNSHPPGAPHDRP